MRNTKVMLKSVITSMALAFLLLSHVELTSSQATTIQIYPENQSVSAQQDFTVSVVVDPGTAIAGAQFNLIFDPSLLTVVSVSEGVLFSQGGANTYFKDPTINNETGKVVGVAGVVLGPNTVSSSGTLAVIYMRAKSTEGTSTLTFENVKIVDENGVAVTTTIQFGSVTVVGAPEGEAPTTTLIVGAVGLIVLGVVLAAILIKGRRYPPSRRKR